MAKGGRFSWEAGGCRGHTGQKTIFFEDPTSTERLPGPMLTESAAYDLDKFRFSARISTYIPSNETGLMQPQRLRNCNILFFEALEKPAAIENLHVLIGCTKLKCD